MKNKKFKLGSKVQWNWMGRAVQGFVKKIYEKPIRKTIRGHIFVRRGSPETPAYLVCSINGNEVLKLHTELSAQK